MALGHEVIGEIISVGSDVKNFKSGDKVLVSAVTPDWSTIPAQAGFSQHSGGMCRGFSFTKVKHGVFAEKFHVNDADSNLAHIPGFSKISGGKWSEILTEKEKKELAAFTMCGDMMTTGFYGAELADIEFGDRVCVIGIGPVGLMAIAACAIRGAAEIFAVGSREICQKVALEYGATHIINYKDTPKYEDKVMELTNKEGVDKVILAGADKDMDILTRAITMIRPGGIIANVAMIGLDFVKPLTINPIFFANGLGDIQIRGGMCPGGRRRLERMARLIMTGRVDVSQIVTHIYDGFEKIEEAFKIMCEKPEGLIKPVVIC
ncbi:NADP-dependent alcohol dehydrogenase [Tritrichomonas foetus]|uniref:NADP-dependent alcohol dehydrogenase n=1 Tax=Tritrichomonas foetus TaxID=1144522 RepID=A0A1J4KFC2_9EUKA|nr:NADP-dependent alcohol dehydrogenase [Tritrichomonas foetus]|eukprot:OHT10153.1 NADP-dependent alcohol dehydrogenase [Tritrichomonas foetus]